jgi:hypothetical protein
MAPRQRAPVATENEAYQHAFEAWRQALAVYLNLARDGAPPKHIQAAALAVHRAALEKGRLAPEQDASG